MNIAIIGAGNISRSHLKAIHTLPDASVVGVADLSAAALAAVSESFQVPTFDNHLTMLDETRPDYVVVATPHYSHVPLALDALERDVHVLVEKPLSVDATEAARCVELAKARGLTLGVNFVLRMTPAQQRVVQLLADGYCGDITHVTMLCARRYRTMAYYNSGTWRGTWQGEGGGVIANQAPHELDFLIQALGCPSELMAELAAFRHDIEVEDEVTALLKWPNGASGTFYASTSLTPGTHSLEINGTHGTLKLSGTQLHRQRLEHDLRDNPEVQPPIVEDQVEDLPKTANPTELMHQGFIQAIRTGSACPCTGEEALAEVELANAMVLSGITRRWTPVPPDRGAFSRVLQSLCETRSLATTAEQLRSQLV